MADRSHSNIEIENEKPMRMSGHLMVDRSQINIKNKKEMFQA